MFIGLGLGLNAVGGGVGNPLDNYGAAHFLADFSRSQYRNAGASTGNFSNLSGLTFTRASTGYAQTSAGVLTSFASGAPRITDKGLLIEGARTNLCLQSQTLGTTWSLTAVTLSADAAAAPDGTLTADLLTENGANSTHRAFQSVSTTAAAYTASAYFKPNGRSWCYLRFTDSGSATRHAWFNLSGSGAVGTLETGMTGTIQALSGGWYRVSATIATALNGSNTPIFGICTQDNESTYIGNSVSGLYYWGAQVELGAFPSSYIPTTTASVTRAGDADPVTISDPGTALSGAVFFRRVVDTGGVETLLQIDDGTANNIIRVAVDASDRAELLIVAGGATQAQIAVTGALSLSARHGISFSATTNSAKVCVDGTLGTEDTSVTMPTGLTTLRIGEGVSIALPSFGHQDKAALWTQIQASAALQAISLLS